MHPLIIKHKEELLELARENGMSNVHVFGSMARGDYNENSDIDLLVTMDPDRSLLDIAVMRRQTYDLLGIKADVVDKDGIRPGILKHVLNDAVPL